MPDRGIPSPHRAFVLSNGFAPQGAPELFGANCSCGWESDALWSDTEAAEQEAANHERESRVDA
jgi:hypothetical protein